MADIRTTTLPDADTTPEAPLSPAHLTIRREDYRPPDWLLPEIALDFDLDAEITRVRATLKVERNGEHDRPLRLDGNDLKLLSVKVDGGDGHWRLDSDQLVVDVSGDQATVETVVETHPAANTKLMGL